MKINHKIIIGTILQELSYRIPSGIPDLTNHEHLSVLSEILTEWNLDDIKGELFRNLNEAEDDKKFTNPDLNKTVQYKSNDGEEKEGIVGNLLRLPKDEPGRIAAEKALGNDETRIQKAMKDLGGENSPTNDTTPGDGQGGEEQPEAPQGTAINPSTKGGKNYTDQLPPNDPASTAPKEEPVVKTKEVDITDFSQKSESTEGLFAGPAQYKRVTVGDTSKVVRPMIDPQTGNALDTSKKNDRLRAIEILDSRLDSLNEKTLAGVKKLEEKGVPKGERTAILKWLGEVGELQAYRSLLQSDKVKDTYLLTDSEPKNDLIITGETSDRNLYLKGISVKTTKINEMANKRGSSVKPDLENGIEGAETRTLQLDGVTDEVDASVVMNSFLELRKRIIKELSMGKARQNPDTKATEVVMEDGEVVSITEYFRRAKVTPNIINQVFDTDKIFQGSKSPIRSLTDDNVNDEIQSAQLREHFKQEFVKMVSEKPDLTVADMEDIIVDKFINIYDKIGANLTPATDTMISYYEESGFAENKIIPKEDAENKIKDVLEVGDFSEIDKKTQFKTILGLDFTGRGMGKKKEGKGYVDGQSFGRPDKRLTPEPIGMDNYIDNYVK